MSFKESWRDKGLSDSQINKIKNYTKEFVNANSGQVSPTERRGYSEVFESWRPLLRSPDTVQKFYIVQELLDRTEN